MNIREAINGIIAGYAIFMVIIVIGNIMYNIIVPYSDYIVLCGGGILLTMIVLMNTAFREEK